jgi:hypothetical protein
MQTRHFYELWEYTDGFFSARQFGSLPPFCKPCFKEGDSTLVSYIDGWDVQPSGDVVDDIETGRKFADLTVSYARKTGSPAFITFVLDAINTKTMLGGNKAISGIEYGFFARIAQVAYRGSLN